MRVCALPRCKKAARPRGKYCCDAHRTEHWKKRTGYVKPARENGGERQKRRVKQRGIDLPYRRTHEAAIKALVAEGFARSHASAVADRITYDAASRANRQRFRPREGVSS